MRALCTVITTLAAVAVFFTPAARADSTDYLILGPSGIADCTFGETGSYTITATLNLSAPAKSLQTSVFATCGGTGIAWNYPVSGDPLTVLTVDFGVLPRTPPRTHSRRPKRGHAARAHRL